eukprot:m.129973 g.129973  ORF g.129973 m.129973 type:complete len:647 (+) comp16424_c0_seq1:75-2015(+)
MMSRLLLQGLGLVALLALSVSAAPACRAMVPGGYTIMYTFDGDTANTGSGGATLAGTRAGAAVLTSSNAFAGQSLSIPDTTSSLTVGGSPTLTYSAGFTLSIWFRNIRNDTTTYRALYRATNLDLYVAMPPPTSNANVGTFVVANSPTGFRQFGTANFSFVINDNTWHQVVLVATSTSLTLYLDGQNLGTYTATFSINGVLSTIGNNATGMPFSPLLDEFVLYPYALSAAQIQSLASSYGPAVCACNGYFTTGAVISYSFDSTLNNGGLLGNAPAFNGVNFNGGTNTTSAVNMLKGGYYNLPNSNSYLQVGSGGTGLFSGFTLSIWVRNIVTSTLPRVLFRGNGTNQIILYTNTTSSSNIQVGLNNGTAFVQYSNYTLDALVADNLWHHFVVVGTGTQQILYVDGVRVGGADFTNTGNIVSIGNSQGQSWRFASDLDEFLFYGTALNDWQVINLYNSYNLATCAFPPDTTTTTTPRTTTTPICFAADSEITLADGSAMRIRDLHWRQKRALPMPQIRDINGRTHYIRRVVSAPSKDVIVTLPAKSIDGELPTRDLGLTANHLVRLNNGTVVTAGELVAALGIQQKLRMEVVYHLETEVWTFLSVHGIGCESAALYPYHFEMRSKAHESGSRPDASCEHEMYTDDRQ